MRSSVLFASVAVVAASVVGVPHSQAHGHGRVHVPRSQPSGYQATASYVYPDIPADAPVGYSQPPPSQSPTHPVVPIPTMPHQSGPNNRDYMGTTLLHHNFHRRNASTPDVPTSDLVWGFELQRIAMDIANTCVFQHDLSQKGGGYGQSMVAGIPADTIGKVMSDTFYNPQEPCFTQYGQPNPDLSNFDQWGFYTQMVWSATQQVACYTVDCSSKGGLQGAPTGASADFTVCNYWPPGNIDGLYKDNVGQPGTMPTMEWCDDAWPFVPNCGSAYGG